MEFARERLGIAEDEELPNIVLQLTHVSLASDTSSWHVFRPSGMGGAGSLLPCVS